MSVRQSMLAGAVLAVVAACATPAATSPAETASPPPTPTGQPAAPTATALAPTSEPTATAPAPTSEPTATAGVDATPTPYRRDDYGYDDDYEGRYDDPTPALTGPPEEVDVALDVASTAAAGEYIVGPAGMALYVFGRDGARQSKCYTRCAEAWPPLTVEQREQPTAADGIGGALAVFERDDGGRQVALDGRPLYYFAGDLEPGDTNGEGIDGLWFLARP